MHRDDQDIQQRKQLKHRAGRDIVHLLIGLVETVATPNSHDPPRQDSLRKRQNKRLSINTVSICEILTPWALYSMVICYEGRGYLRRMTWMAGIEPSIKRKVALSGYIQRKCDCIMSVFFLRFLDES